MVQVSVFLIRCGETQVEAWNEAELSQTAQDDHAMPSDVAAQGDDLIEYHSSDDDDDDDNSSSHAPAESPPDPASPPQGSQTNKDDIPVHTPTVHADSATPVSTPNDNPDDNDDEENNNKPPGIRLSERVDPLLTETGYDQAQQTLHHLMKGLSESTDQERRMAAISSPTKACAGTALMLSTAGLMRFTNLRWQLATIKCISAPFAVPIVIHNTLCAAEPEIAVCGGHEPVVEAGLLHASAMPWNDARPKCPFGLVLKQFKHMAKAPARQWKEAATQLEPRRCTDVQYFRVHDTPNPWTLKELTMKTNVLVDLIDPNRYNTPPRKGFLALKGDKNVNVPKLPGPYEAVQESVWWARQVGCDVVLLFVGQAAMQDLAKTAGLLPPDTVLEVPPCSMASCIATVPDDSSSAANASSIQLALHGFYTTDELSADPASTIPPYTGPVNVAIPPPPGNDPMTIPVNQWSKFPPPEPENIPDDYPDLPPFCNALTAPVPKRWRPSSGGATSSSTQQPQRPAPERAAVNSDNEAAAAATEPEPTLVPAAE